MGKKLKIINSIVIIKNNLIIDYLKIKDKKINLKSNLNVFQKIKIKKDNRFR